ncbi:MAG: ABC transporter permease [Christensenellaceae bacterium]|jgi:ribose transport system permease protein
MNNEMKQTAGKAAGSGSKVTNVLSNVMLKYGIYLAFIVIFIVFSLSNESFLTPTNIRNIIIQCAFIAVAGVGQTLVILTGGIDLSVSSLLSLTGVIMGFAAVSGMGLAAIIFIALILGVGVGATNGVLIGVLKMPPFVVTLGTQGICRGIALVISQGSPFSQFPEGFGFLGGGYVGEFPVIIFAVIIVYLLAWVFTTRTRTGRYIYAIGGNREAARVSGVSVAKFEMIAYTLCGLIVAFAGILLTSRLNFATPTAGDGYELETIAAVVIGGTMMSGGSGNVLKTFIGALLLYTLKNGLTINNVSSYYQNIVTGVVLVAAVFLDTLKNKKKI